MREIGIDGSQRLSSLSLQILLGTPESPAHFPRHLSRSLQLGHFTSGGGRPTEAGVGARLGSDQAGAGVEAGCKSLSHPLRHGRIRSVGL